MKVRLEDKVPDVPLETVEKEDALVGTRCEGLLPVGRLVTDDGELRQFDLLDAFDTRLQHMTTSE